MWHKSTRIITDLTCVRKYEALYKCNCLFVLPRINQPQLKSFITYKSTIRHATVILSSIKTEYET